MSKTLVLLCIFTGSIFLGEAFAENKFIFPKTPSFDPDNVTLTLYTPYTKNASRILIGRPETVYHYDRTWGLKVLIHGLGEHAGVGWMTETRDVFLEKGFNVITVDWSFYAEGWKFAEALKSPLPVGQWVSSVILWLNKHIGMESSEHHVIGFSMGGQVAGVVGFHLQNPKLARITGLDPAGPFYENRPLPERLDPSDAQFVDVIHTNGGTLVSGGLGFPTSIGHVDFYPNGGQRQPGCETPIFFKGRVVFPYATSASGCSHGRAVQFHLESILNPNAFHSVACSDVTNYTKGFCNGVTETNRMGFFALPSSHGDFYLATRAETPYNANDIFVNVTIATSQNQTAGTSTIVIEGDGFREQRNLLKEKSFKGGDVLSSVIGISPDMDSITRVKVTYVKRTSSLDEWLLVQRISIYDPKRNKRYCVGYFEVQSGSQKTIETSKC